jgi:hypothetical protein
MRFPFDFAPAYRLPALLVGVTPRTAYVDVVDRRFRVRFGLWRVDTPLSNIIEHEFTG